jgi:hypothetical protein
MAEQTFFNSGGVTVTNARFIVPGQTYAMSGVTSVKSSRHNPSRIGPIILIVIGVIALAAGKNGIVAAILFLAGGIAWWVLHKPKYSVVLSSASGEAEALIHKDEAFISQIVKALNEAIIARG